MIDEAAIMACSDWLDLHPQTDDYFQYLIVVNKKITQDQSYDVFMKIIIDEANAVDKVKHMTCSEWLNLHPMTQECLQILIDENRIVPEQADYVIKKIIIDERGTTYKNLDVCAFDLWCDLQEIPGHFSVLARI